MLFRSDDSPVRPLGFSALSHFGPTASQKRLTGEFQFKLATEVVVHGSTRPGSQVTVQGDQVQLRDDGSFTFRIPQPEGRQVLAFTAMTDAVYRLSPPFGERTSRLQAVALPVPK